MIWLRRLRWRLQGTTVWRPSNIYPTARLGKGVSVGAFSEIGAGVVVGDRTRIGMGVFIPKGVHIGCDCFIGPKVCFVHDNLEWVKFPGKSEEHWKQTDVGSRVAIGANAMILPGVQISRGALIGAGAVVTKYVGPGEVWFGNPATFRRMRNGTDTR